MSYIKLYFTVGGGQVEPAGDGVGGPVSFTLRADLDEIGIPIGLTAKSDDGYVCDDVVITPTGTTAEKWVLAPDVGGSPGAFGAYGDPLGLGICDDTTGVPFWVKAKATNDEAPANDDSVTLEVTGIASVE